MAEREPIERRESPGHPTGAEMGNKAAIDEGSRSPAPAEAEWGGMTASPGSNAAFVWPAVKTGTLE